MAKKKELFWKKYMIGKKGRKEKRKRVKDVYKIFSMLQRVYGNRSFDGMEGKTDIGVINFSKLGNYRGCRLAYLLLYIAKAKKQISKFMAYGRAMHLTLENINKRLYNDTREMFDGIKSPNKKKMKVIGWKGNYFSTMYSSGIEFSDDKEIFRIYSKGAKALRAYFAKNKDRPAPLFVEEPFDFELNGIKFNGRIDRIDLTPEGIEITDLKTGFKLSEIEEILNFQPTIYIYAYRQMQKKDPEKYLSPDIPISFTWDYVDLGLTRNVRRRQFDLDFLMSTIDWTNKGNRDRQLYSKFFIDFLNPFTGFHCRKQGCKVSEPCKELVELVINESCRSGRGEYL